MAKAAAQAKMEYKALPIYVQAIDEQQGIVEAIVAVMGNVDHQGDIIMPGAFTKTIQERGAKIRILDNHNAHSTLDVVGKPLSLREIGRDELPADLIAEHPDATGGLLASIQFLIDTPEGLGVFKRLKAGAVGEYSIGYDALDPKMERVERGGEEIVVRKLQQIRLWELSPVIFASNSATTTVSAKAAGAEPSEGKPWGVEQRDGEFCVFKLDADGNLDGDALQCYADEAEAITYLRALYANVEDAGDDKGAGTGDETKEGRVLSARNANRLLSAMASMLETLEDAGHDLPGWVKVEAEEDGDKGSTYLVAIKRRQKGKAESLDARIRQVRDAFYDQHRGPGAEMQVETASPYWVQEVYPSFIIVEDGAQLYAYPYTIDITTGSITFSDRYPVEVTYIRIDPDKSSAPTQGRADSEHDEKAGPDSCPPTNSDVLAQLQMLGLELSLLEVT